MFSNCTPINFEAASPQSKHNNTRDRQIDLTEQQRRLVDEESRASAEVESTYAMAYCLFSAVSIYCSTG
jgi:hypothetical protein